MTRRSTTDTVIKIARGLPSAVKIVAGVGLLLGTLYGGVRFVVDVEYERHEKARQKIGRQEFTRYKEDVRARMEKIEAKLEKLDDRLDSK